VSCPRCGRSNRAGARFCDGCGAGLAALSAEKVARKVVTIVFADLIGSTALHEKLDPESVSRVMEAYHAAVRAPIEAHGGTVVQLLGDGVMCAFGVPQVAEDDALRAVRAAVDVQRSFREFLRAHEELAGRVGLRVAVNTGEVVVSDDYAAGIGDPLNVAARLQQEAKDGDVLVGGATQRFVADQVTLAPVGSFALRGRAEPVAAWRVVSLERPSRAAAVDFVGRADELRRLGAVYEAAAGGAHAKLALVLGSPGLGKSRLLVELARSLAGRATVLVAQCSASGGASFAPLAEALRAALDAAARPDDPERARIEAGIGAILAGTPAPPEESFFVVRRLLAALAAERPVVLVIDDLQWAEPLLLDLVEHLVQWGAGVPLFVLAAARPELRELRSSLAAPGGLVSDVLHLAGLDASASTRLAASVIGADALPAAVAGRVLAASEGNPLFLGELVRMLANDGVLRREGERWVTAVALSDLDMPPNIQALLAARIERLRPEERLVLERAAVVGRQFSRAALAHLLPREAQGDLDARLESLRRSELIEFDGGDWFLGEPALRFHHVLIRDAAYRRPLRHTRAELHARFADWLAERAGGDVALHDETIGWHLEQAFLHRRELGALDAPARALGARAARHLADAGRRALARDDLPRAASGLGRALECLDAEDPARAELALDWCEALLAAGDVAPAARALAELARFAEGSERLRAWHTSFAGQLAVLSDPQALRACEAAVAGAADALAAAGDAAGEAKAHSVHALVLAQLGRIGASEAALDRALAAARRARDRRRANAVLAGAPVAALWGPSPVTRASGRCLDVVRVLRITQGAPAVEAVALRCQAVLETLRGRSEAARRMIASSRRMVEELGITQRVLEADVFAGLIELLEGDGATAERWLRPAYAGLRTQGLGIDAAQAAALLGRALLGQGRAEEAEALSRESEALAGDSFKAAIAWRCVRAEALAARGEPESAVALARAAVEIAAATDDLLDHADARHALAVALRAAGRGAEADAEEARAVELWQAKGATLLAERVRSAGTRAELRGPAPETRPALLRAGRVRENAATASVARFVAAARARDIEAIAALCADGLRVIHHPTGATIDREAGLERWRLLFRAEGLEIAYETLATLGASLGLTRDATSFDHVSRDELSFGASRSSYLNLGEVDERGLLARLEVFAENRLADAIVRLYERHAELLSEGPERTRAAAIARTVGAMLAEGFDPDRYATVFAPEIEALDHRTLGTHSGQGADALLEALRAWLALAADASVRSDAVLGLGPDALLERITFSGADGAGGGSFERAFLRLLAFGGDGLLVRIEWFDGDREAQALARFDAIAKPPPARFENAAVRAGERFIRAWAARDWDAMIANFAPSFEVDDRRALVGVPISGPEFFANQRHLFAMKSTRWEGEVLATRGERYALRRARFSGEDDAGGAGEVVLLTLTEVDRSERYVWQALFDPDAVEAAYQAFDARYVAGEGAAHTALLTSLLEFRRALADADREALARILPDDFTVTSHRRFANVGATLSRDEYVANLGFYDELGVRAGFRVEHLRVSAAALIADISWHGTREGGAFESPFVMVGRHDGDRIHGWELFDRDETDAAFARYRALSAAPAALRIENAATRLSDRIHAAWRAREWAAFDACYAPGYRIVDRQRGVQLESTRAAWLGSYRPIFEMASSQLLQEVLATRGERLGLFRVSWRGADGAVGASEMDALLVAEADEQGGFATQVVFDPDGFAAAYAELDARYEAGEAAGDAAWREMRSWAESFGRRDFAALAAQAGPGFELRDHRALGWGTVDAERFVELLRSLVELAPARLRIEHFESCARGSLTVAAMHGTRDGGAFEVPRVGVREIDAAGRLRRLDHYDLAQLDAARARFAELREPAPAWRLENAAARAQADFERAWRERRLADVLSSFAQTVELDDRRALVGLRVRGEEFLTNLRLLFETPSSEWRSEPLATRGQRLALLRSHFSAEAGAGAPIAVEHLSLVERDDDRRAVSVVVFDAEQEEAARAELDARFLAGEAAAHRHVAATMRAFLTAFARRDWDAVGALFAEDVAVHDQRRLGWEPLSGRAAYVASLRALVELSPDVRLRLDHARLSARGVLWVASWVGTREGGPFETPWIIVSEHEAAGIVRRFDQFDVEGLDAALERFAELGPDPLAIPPNAAVRAADRIRQCMRAGDWDGLRALAARGFTFDDRRRRALVRGDIELYARNLEVVQSYPELRPSRELLATLGERIALSRLSYVGGGEADAFEGEFLVLNEVDDQMRLHAVIHFDPADRTAAFAEAHARFVAGEARGHAGQAAISTLARAFATHDWEALRACFGADGSVHDRRTLGLGPQGPEQWIASLRAFAELAPDVTVEPIRILAWREGGRMSALRVHGSREGGPFENVFLGVAFARGDRVERYEFFDVADEARALARFEELCAGAR